MFIDTHCHLSCNDYDDIDLVVEENRNNGIKNIIVSGCTRDDIEETIVLANKYEDVYITLGYHPSEASIVTEEDMDRLTYLLKNHPKVVGVGEIGLDYHYEEYDKELQFKLFRRQLDIAKELNLPVVIHSRDATEDTIKILKEYDLKGDIHCFSGSLETAKIYVSMGYKLGIGGVLTFKNSKLYKVLEGIGLQNILLETDSPYLAPVPLRGTKNTSKNIPIIAEKIAEILNVSVEEVSKMTLQNTYQLFDLK